MLYSFGQALDRFLRMSHILKKAANNSESSVSKTIDAERTEQQGMKILGINLH